jgi:hypothetical protein
MRPSAPVFAGGRGQKGSSLREVKAFLNDFSSPSCQACSLNSAPVFLITGMLFRLSNIQQGEYMDFVLATLAACAVFAFCFAVFILKGRREGDSTRLHKCAREHDCRCHGNNAPGHGRCRKGASTIGKTLQRDFPDDHAYASIVRPTAGAKSIVPPLV